MDIIQLAGSLIAILLLALLAWRLFPVQSKMDIDRVKRNIRRYCPDLSEDIANNARIFISSCGQAAIADLKTNNGIVVLRQTGDRIAVRRFGSETNMRVTQKNNSLRIDIHDFTMPAFMVDLDDNNKTELMQILEAYCTRNGATAHA